MRSIIARCYVCGQIKNVEVIYTPIGKLPFYICEDCKAKRSEEVWTP